MRIREDLFPAGGSFVRLRDDDRRDFLDLAVLEFEKLGDFSAVGPLRVGSHGHRAVAGDLAGLLSGRMIEAHHREHQAAFAIDDREAPRVDGVDVGEDLGVELLSAAQRAQPRGGRSRAGLNSACSSVEADRLPVVSWSWGSR